MKAFIKLYAINFFKSPSSTFFIFLFPIMMLFILGGIMPFSYIAGGMFVLPTISIALIAAPSAINEFKSSSIFKRIGLLNVAKYKVFLSLIIFYIIVMVVSTLWITGIVLLFNHFNIGEMAFEYVVPGTGDIAILDAHIKFAHIGFSEWLYMLIVIMVTGISLIPIGVFLGLKGKDTMAATMKGLLVYFPITFLGGVFLDLTMLKRTESLNAISKILPTRWLMEPVILIFNNSAESGWYNALGDSTWYLWAGPLASILIGGLFLLLVVKRFEWDD